MIKRVVRQILTQLAWLKVFFFIGNSLGPKSRFSWSVDVRYSNLQGNNYVGRNSLVHKCIVGDHSYIGDHCRFFNVNIGKFTSIGSNVKTGFGSHPYHFFSQHPSTYSTGGDTPSLAKENIFLNEHRFISERFFVTIGHDVWIGDNVNILDGVKIGNGAVIGINALVTHDVPAYAIVIGMPAKILKYRFPKGIITKLLKIEWWIWEERLIKKAVEGKLFNSDITSIDKLIKFKTKNL